MEVAAGPVLEATNLYRFFHSGDDEVQALRGVDLTVAPGELIAVIGPSGSGKSTLLACLAGLDEPDGGQIRVAGELMTRQPEADRAALRARTIGVLFQNDNLVPHLDVDTNIRLVQRLSGHDDPARRRAVLEQLGIAGRAHAFPSQLSGGEAVRAALAVAIANDPPLLLADEPTGELDQTTEAQVLAVLQHEVASGRAAIVASHSGAVEAAATRVLALEDGRVLENPVHV